MDELAKNQKIVYDTFCGTDISDELFWLKNIISALWIEKKITKSEAGNIFKSIMIPNYNTVFNAERGIK